MALNAVDSLPDGPTTTELVELLEHQDHIMDSLQEELEICKHQLDLFKRAERERTKTDDAAATLITEAEKKVNVALAAVEALQAHNANLEAEIKHLREKLEEDRPVATVNHLRTKIIELELALEKEESINEGIRRQLEESELKSEALKVTIDSGTKAKEGLIHMLQSKVDTLTKEAVETRFKLDELQADSEHASLHLSGELELAKTREAQLNSILEQISKEINSLRSERGTMSSRIAALTQENASLRLKAVRKNINDPIYAGATETQMQKLLSDQSHLISALQEESKLLTERLEQERLDFKRSIKKLKHEKKELQERIQKLIHS